MKSSVTLTRRAPRIVAQLEPRSKRRFATRRNQASRDHSPTPERLMQLAWGYAPPLILEAALNHRLFDLLDKAPQTVGELAVQSGASARGLTAILNALVALEFLVRRGDRYALTPESAAFLVSTKPAYRGGMFRHVTHQILPQWMQLTEVVRTGRPAVAGNQQEEGQKFFAEYVEGLFPVSYNAAQVLGAHLGIPKAASPVSVLDIGAGSGVLGNALAQQSPHVTIHAVDWPVVLKVTQKLARQHGVADRLRTVAGDLLEADFGSGHRVATIGHILHSEGRDRSRRLLRKTFASLAPGGTIVISEFVPSDDRTGPPTPLIFAVNMLLHTEAGDTFTFAEIAGWLREAGFANPRMLEAPAPSPLILATRP
jgi:2-polyprenyl-3-methyl-5-hydroxy-6-metoxy-1,4-benzoquinol methylase